MEQTDEVLATRAVRRTMSLRLAMWSGASMLLGLALWLVGSALASAHVRAVVEAFAAQCVFWGLLESGFALLGLKQAQAAERAPATDPSAAHRELADRDRLVRLLRFNVRVLNWLFLGLGAAMLVTALSLGRPTLLGHGIGVLLHSTFLALFDRAFLIMLMTIAQSADNPAR